MRSSPCRVFHPRWYYLFICGHVILAAVYCAFLGYGAWQVLTSGVSAGDKGFFVIFVAVVIAIYAAVLIFAWTDWLRKRRRTP